MSKESQGNRTSYEQLFITLSTKVEKVLIRLMLVFLLLLLCSQSLLQVHYLRMVFTRIEPLEGKPYTEYPQSSSESR
jgi:hypothetical protein